MSEARAKSWQLDKIAADPVSSFDEITVSGLAKDLKWALSRLKSSEKMLDDAISAGLKAREDAKGCEYRLERVLALPNDRDGVDAWDAGYYHGLKAAQDAASPVEELSPEEAFERTKDKFKGALKELSEPD